MSTYLIDNKIFQPSADKMIILDTCSSLSKELNCVTTYLVFITITLLLCLLFHKNKPTNHIFGFLLCTMFHYVINNGRKW